MWDNSGGERVLCVKWSMDRRGYSLVTGDKRQRGRERIRNYGEERHEFRMGIGQRDSRRRLDEWRRGLVSSQLLGRKD